MANMVALVTPLLCIHPLIVTAGRDMDTGSAQSVPPNGADRAEIVAAESNIAALATRVVPQHGSVRSVHFGQLRQDVLVDEVGEVDLAGAVDHDPG
jgi:hypothetical protein